MTACQFCGKECRKGPGIVNHEKWCAKNPANAKPAEPAKLVETPAAAQIQIVNDFSPVPALPSESGNGEVAPPAVPNGQDDDLESLRQSIIQEGEKKAEELIKIDFSGFGEGLCGTINKRLKAKNVRPLEKAEEERITRNFETVCQKRLYLMYKYGDIINLGLALALPLMARLDELPSVKDKNSNKENQIRQETPSKESISEQDRALKEFQLLRKE